MAARNSENVSVRRKRFGAQITTPIPTSWKNALNTLAQKLGPNVTVSDLDREGLFDLLRKHGIEVEEVQ